jgi:1,4-dihydroxy-2-naphthoyl-CoA synthase
LEFARGVAAKSPDGVRMAKDVLNRGYADGTDVDEALRLEADATTLYVTTLPDSMEGLRAFAERRAPPFHRRAPSDPVSVGAGSRDDRWPAERDPAALRRS